MKKIYTWALLIFVFTIPVSQFVNVRLQVILLLLSFFVKTENSLAIFTKRSWDIIFYLFILVAGLAYSQDLSTGLRILETNFSLLAFPIILSRVTLSEHQLLRKIFNAFLVGLIASSLICLSVGVYRYSQHHDIQFLFFDNFTEPIYSHPTYFAYYLIFAISVELYFLFYNEEQEKTILKNLTIVFLFFVLILTGGQTAFISLLFVFSFFILKYLTEEKGKGRGMVITMVSVMLFCMFLVTIVESNNSQARALNDSWERAILWESAMAAVPNLLLGVGTGDYKMALNDYYATHNLAQFASGSYNAHNQLIQILFSNGILGVIAFSLMLGRPLYLAVQNKNILAILCLFPFLIYGITEVFLGRYQGIVFFAFLHQIFVAEMTSDTLRPKISIKEPLSSVR